MTSSRDRRNNKYYKDDKDKKESKPTDRPTDRKLSSDKISKNGTEKEMKLASVIVPKEKAATRDISTIEQNNSKYSTNNRNYESKVKFYEEFLKLKEIEEKDVKLKLPKLITKKEEEQKSNINLEDKYQLGGLVHEKEEFSRPHFNKFDEANRKYNYKKRSFEHENRRPGYNSYNSYNNNWYHSKPVSNSSYWKRNKYY